MQNVKNASHAIIALNNMNASCAFPLFFILSSGALCIKQFFCFNYLKYALESQLDEVFNKKAIRGIFGVFQVCVGWGTPKLTWGGSGGTPNTKVGGTFQKSPKDRKSASPLPPLPGLKYTPGGGGH